MGTTQYKTSVLEKYTKYTSILSILFFVGAVLFEILYYRRFGIDIFTYISFSEIISIFIGNIPILLFFAIIIIGFLYLLKRLFRDLIEKLSNIDKFNRQERQKLNEKITFISMYSFFIWFVLVMGPLIYSVGKFVHSEFYFYMKVFATLIFISNIVFPLFLSRFLREDTTSLFIIIFIISFYTVIYIFSNKLIWNVRNQPEKNPSVQIFLKNGQCISTSDTLVYLGKTNNYIFLYNNTDKIETLASSVIKMENIDSLKIFKSVPWVIPF